LPRFFRKNKLRRGILSQQEVKSCAHLREKRGEENALHDEKTGMIVKTEINPEKRKCKNTTNC